MWYLTWILGLLFACSMTVILLLWLENHDNKPLDPPE